MYYERLSVMRSWLMLCGAAALTLVIACAARPHAPHRVAGPAGEVAALLRQEWALPYRVTTIDQAMDRKGIPWSDRLRRSVAAELRAVQPSPDLPGRQSYQWEPLIYVPSNDERRMARMVESRCEGRDASRSLCPVAAAEIAAEVGVAPFRATEGLALLADLGLLVAREGGYTPGPEEHRRAGLGLAFHEVRTRGMRFNVQ